MSGVILLPQRFTSQPQYDAPISPAWLKRGLVVACNPAVGAYNQVSRQHVTNGGGLTTTPTGSGKSWNGGTSKYIDFGAPYDPGTEGMTVLQIVNPGSAVNVFPFSNRSASSTAGFEFLIGNGATPGLARFRMHNPEVATGDITGLSDGKDHVLIARFTPSTEIKIWADSLSKSSANTTSIPASTTSTQNLRLHSRSTTWYPSKSGLFLLFNNPRPEDDVGELFENPYSYCQAPPIRIYISSGTTWHDLTGAASTQANTAGSGAITQTHALAAPTSTQSNFASSAAVTQDHALAAAPASQVNIGSSPAVTQDHVLAGAGSTQENAAGVGEITQGVQFVADVSTQANVAGTGAITQAHVLTAANGLQVNASSSAAVTQDHALAVAGSTQGNTAGTGAITQGTTHDLTAANSSQANTGAAGAITQTHILVCAPSVQDNIAAASAIVQAHVLISASGAQANTGSTGAIEQVSGVPPVDGPAGSGPRLRTAHVRRPSMRNISRPRQLR